MMTLAAYFEQHDGIGILATCDPDNLVDLAVYSKPVVIDETTVAFVMRQRISHKNLRANLNAAYMFIEKGPGYQGKRLYLTMQREETNRTVIESLRKKQPWIYPAGDDSEKFLVFFTINHIRPLVGDGASQ
ncbi:MAG TPA: pyridoxamine 5'-phosphate oxidase family protein [Anaerohalosphaeraceae bacterium]|nr:pyridoxamine 5'-phosphate oxidase family protein [Anaerohalosphaeraceae bacterium]